MKGQGSQSLVKEEEREDGAVKFSVYSNYLRRTGVEARAPDACVHGVLRAYSGTNKLIFFLLSKSLQ
jgi:hypothetical protein